MITNPKLKINVGSSTVEMNLKDWIKTRDRITAAVQRTKIRCTGCGLSTLPLENCGECGRSLA